MKNTYPARLVANCFAARTAAHHAHLRTGSYSAHMALGSFYEDIAAPTDQFAEVWQGVNRQRLGRPEEPDLDDENITGDGRETIRKLHDWAVKNKAACCGGHPGLEAVVDEITIVCAQALYKLDLLE